MAEFAEFIDKYTESPESVRARMDLDADPTLDKREGQPYHDYTVGATREIAMLWDLTNDTLASAFLMHASGVYLDYKAAETNTFRKTPTHADGEVTFTGTNGTVVPVGTRTSTESVGDESDPIVFVTTEEGTISGGTVTVDVQAVDAGVVGNVGIGAVIIMEDEVTGVTGVTNAAIMQGGTDEEEDDDLRQRALDAIAEPTGAGTPFDYKRWLTSRPGVGNNVAVFPRWNGVNTVKAVIVTPSNDPVSQTTLDDAQEFISGPPKLANPTTAPLLSLTVSPGWSATNVRYKIAFSDGGGITKVSPASDPVTPVDQRVNLTGIEIGPAGTKSRVIYKSINGGVYYRHATINDNTTTVYTDTVGPVATTLPAPQTNNTTEYDGIAPPGADVTISTPVSVPVSVTATIAFRSGYSLDGTAATVARRALIEASIRTYLDNLLPGEDVVFNRIEAQMFVDGVLDVSGTQIGGGGANVVIADEQVAQTGVISLS